MVGGGLNRLTQSASNFRPQQIVANQKKSPRPMVPPRFWLQQTHARLYTYDMQPHVICIMCATYDHVASTTSTAPASIRLNIHTTLRRRRSHHLPYQSALRSNTFSITSLRFSLLPKTPKGPKGVKMKYLNGAAGTVSKHPIPILRGFIHCASKVHGS